MIPANSRTEDELYRKMKCSQGGVMLLIRLHADLAEQPSEFLRRMCTLDLLPDPLGELPAGSRLHSTYQWLDRKFGQRNAVQAMIETATEVLRVPSVP